MEQPETFATAINCMDGRAIRAVLEYFEREHGISYVDMPTEPGPDGLLQSDEQARQRVRQRVVDISVGKHNSRIVAVVGHPECAGHPVTLKQHEEDVQAGIAVVREWTFDCAEPILLIGLIAERAGDTWHAREIMRTVVSPQVVGGVVS